MSDILILPATLSNLNNFDAEEVKAFEARLETVAPEDICSMYKADDNKRFKLYIDKERKSASNLVCLIQGIVSHKIKS